MQPNVSVPDVLLRQLAAAAKEAGVAADEFATLAIAEKIARSEHSRWLEKHKTTLTEGIAG